MARLDTFTFRVTKEELAMLQALAAHLDRTPSDVIRLLIREASKSSPASRVSVQVSPSPVFPGGLAQQN